MPLSRVYRAFPELDRFTNEQCEEYVRQVRRRFRHGRRVQTALRTLGMLTMGLACFIGSILAIVTVTDAMNTSRLIEHPALGAISIALLTAVPSMAFFFGMQHRWLRRRIRDHMKEIRCPQCRYVMLGLSVRNGIMTCPECGERIELALLGLTPADVLGVESEPLELPDPNRRSVADATG